ncbi:MAG TPA: hypothetical protein DIW23_15315 [Anaerolineae bacterium]|nr:hypothetical protein [Anaerolineae bacterium]HRJ74729.1 hypothetical protein [Anaerolineales bacterium]
MKLNSKSIEAKLMLTSRATFLSAIALFAGATVLIMTHYSMWMIAGLLFTIGAVLFLISAIAPGILIITKHPNLAYAWRNGIYPLAFSDTPWELLSSKQRKLVYIDSIISLFVVIVFIIWFISEQYMS